MHPDFAAVIARALAHDPAARFVPAAKEAPAPPRPPLHAIAALVTLLLAAVAGAAIVTAFALLFPQCLGRPEGVSPELKTYVVSHQVKGSAGFVTGVPRLDIPDLEIVDKRWGQPQGSPRPRQRRRPPRRGR